VFGVLLIGVFALSDERQAFNELLGRLGFAHAFERICPRLAEQYALDLNCLSGEERRQFLGEGQPTDPDKTTEGERLVSLRTAFAGIVEHPWLGMGAGRGTDRLIASPVVANL
jgi:hypothetical protein